MEIKNTLSASSTAIQAYLDSIGFATQVLELPASTRTAKEAAQALDCQVGQIVKSLIFKTSATNQALLILASGINQVDETRISAAIGEKIEKADAQFTREVTGFAIGGIPPVGHKTRLRTLIDQDLLTYPELWAAAGTPRSVFKFRSDDVVILTGGTVLKIN